MLVEVARREAVRPWRSPSERTLLPLLARDRAAERKAGAPAEMSATCRF
jgi:hypothetical protein